MVSLAAYRKFRVALSEGSKVPAETQAIIPPIAYYCEKHVMMCGMPYVFSPPQYLMQCGLQCGFSGEYKTVAAHERVCQPQRGWFKKHKSQK